MRHWSAVVTLCLLALLPLHGRGFTSADGSKVIEAEFIRYNHKTGKVTLRVGGMRQLVVPAASFSADDRAYFMQAQKQIDMKESLSAKIQRDTVAGRIMFFGEEMTDRKVTYSFVISHKGVTTLAGMSMEFWVLVKHEADGKERMQVVHERVALADLAPESTTTIKAPPVDMDDFVRLPLVDKDGVEREYNIRRKNDIYGARVQLLAPDGSVVLSESTSNRVDKHLDD